MTKKKQVKQMLKGAATVDCVEGQLALAVILKAVDDIGAVRTKADYRRMDTSLDSTAAIKQGGLDFWLEAVNIDRSYFHRVLKTTGLLRHGLV